MTSLWFLVECLTFILAIWYNISLRLIHFDWIMEWSIVILRGHRLEVSNFQMETWQLLRIASDRLDEPGIKPLDTIQMVYQLHHSSS